MHQKDEVLLKNELVLEYAVTRRFLQLLQLKPSSEDNTSDSVWLLLLNILNHSTITGSSG